MENTNTPFLHEIYVKYVETISGIRFTQREIDVIACVLYNRGATIPSFLSIAPRTVETHIRNIMQKIRCNSREGIIDFIEKSDKHELIKQYYSMLITSRSFERCLKRIAELRVKKPPIHLIINCDSVLYQSSLVQAIVKDSQLAGIHMHLHLQALHHEGDIPHNNVILVPAAEARPFISLKANLPEDLLETAYVLFDEAENAIVLLEQNEAFCFYKDPDTHYYDAFCSFLTRLLSDVDLTPVFNEFRQQLQNRPPVFTAPSSSTADTKHNHPGDTRIDTWFWRICTHEKKKVLAGALFLCLSVFVYLTFFHETFTVHSEFSLPKESIFLDRPQLEKQMRMVLNGQSGIKKIALVGFGGSGKTTLARKFARSEKSSIKWELNAESSDTLIQSLKELSYALANTKEKKEELEFIQKITNIKERDNQTMLFVKNNLKQSGDWLLIYDNVENFTTIMPCLPHDVNVWGRGTVLITTRNANVQNCFYINTDDVIQMNALSETEKNKLFTMILSDKAPASNNNNKQEVLSFLKELPSFPLDILTAAYYIKDTNVPYTSYLREVKTLSADFVATQESFLVDTCPPTKTRYGMISLTLTKLIHDNPTYKELLFFISLMDSQNIPKKVLTYYLNNTLIEPFMHALRGQSLITYENTTDTHSPHYFSLHRSVQEADLVFFEKAFTPKTMGLFVSRFIAAVVTFVQSDLKNDHQKMALFLPHLEAMTHNLEKLPLSEQEKETYKQHLFLLLGNAHYTSTHNLPLAKQYFLKVDEIQAKTKALDKNTMAKLLKNIGAISVLLNALKDVQNCCERSIMLCADIPHSEMLIADNLQVIGSYYRKVDDVVLAKQYYENALEILKTTPLEDRKTLEAEIYTQLSFYYNNSVIDKMSTEGVKYAQKALEISNAAQFFRNTPHQNSKQLSCTISKYKWILGQAYSRVGKYKNALDEGFLEARYVMEHSNDNCTSDLLLKGRIAEGVGEALLREGDFEKSAREFTEAIRIYERLLGAFTTLSARVYRIEALVQLGKLDQAYQECLAVFALERRGKCRHLEMIDVTTPYHAAVITYKQNDFEKTARYLTEFFIKSQKLSKAALDAKTYEALAAKGAFTPCGQEHITKALIHEHFRKCREIFTALYSASIYGADHPFLTSYVGKCVLNE